jgi:RNA polymerase sigma factor (sigma-70 family)
MLPAAMTLPRVHAPIHGPSEVAGDSSPAAAADVEVERCTSRLVDGDRAAYEELYRLRCTFVEDESLRRLGRRRDLAADVSQEAWMRVARGPRRCTGTASLDAWLRRIVRSAAIDMLRQELARRLRERRVAEERAESVAFLKDHDLLEEIRHEASEVAGMSRDEQSIFELMIRADGTVAQLAGMLGIGRAALDSRLRRAAERARARRNTP